MSARMTATREALELLQVDLEFADAETREAKLAALAEVEEWEARLAAADSEIEKAKDFSYASHRQRAVAAEAERDALEEWHTASVPLIAALAIYGEGVNVAALVEKARVLNENRAALAADGGT